MVLLCGRRARMRSTLANDTPRSLIDLGGLLPDDGPLGGCEKVCGGAALRFFYFSTTLLLARSTRHAGGPDRGFAVRVTVPRLTQFRDLAIKTLPSIAAPNNFSAAA